MTSSRAMSICFLLAAVTAAPAQQDQREPHIGYVYPAGGRQGAVIRITVGGQALRGVTDVYLTGSGVQGRVIRHYPPLRNASPEQREALVARMRELIGQRWAELQKKGRVEGDPPWARLVPGGPKRPGAATREGTATTQPVELPEHPLLYDLEHQSLRELLHVRAIFADIRKGQPNPQIAESVLIEVTIEREAPAGDRELRLGGNRGLTNPLVFEVGPWRETCELEDNDPEADDVLPAEPPLELPVVINGQIMPGDVDRFRFLARQGQGLVVETHARRLIPYLADAVPGWFQATLAVYDSAGHEVAFADDYRFDPDPVLYCKVPADGEYELEIRDSIYRGREDFVYRIIAGPRPFITAMLPLGGRAGQNRFVDIEGWNLPTRRLVLETKSEEAGICRKYLGVGTHVSNRVTYAVDTLRADDEKEDNDTLADAQSVKLPRIVDGRIAAPGDVDLFQFKGRAGDEIVAEVAARRLNSPLDSLLRIMDAAGNIVAWNDDWEHKDGALYTDMGVLTHSADSYLRAVLPDAGVYFVQLTDTQEQGGPAYGYRLRLGPPLPDFELRLVPASVNVRAGMAAPLDVHVLRKDGFAGEIGLALVDAPNGFVLHGGRVPAGRDRVRVTLGATAPLERPVALHLEGWAEIDGQRVRHRAVPAEDLMQAFLYRHLAPSQELMVAVLGGGGGGRPVELAGAAPLRIASGGTGLVHVQIPRRLRARQFELELSQPPPGITLRNMQPTTEGCVFELHAESGVVATGLVDNLIVEVFTEIQRKGPEDLQAGEKQRVYVGVLPAIPIEVVEQ